MGQTASHATVYPFIYQSYNISFSDWVTIFTLSLAPFIAHVVGGAPSFSVISQKPMRWHDSLTHYNPTSIIWRYAAIADRRIRARKWSSIDMAATNALFWTKHGWDGSEDMVGTSLPYCTSIPEHTRTSILSTETINTLIITLQAAQALYSLSSSAGTSSSNTHGVQDGIDYIFFPLAVLGLFRLFAAGWLTHEYSYTARMELTSQTPDPLAEKGEMTRVDSDGDALVAGYKPTSYWGSILFRAVYMSLLLAVWVMALLRSAPLTGETWAKSMTTFLEGIFYLFFTTVSCVLFAWYFPRGGTTSTIIPCISHAWYKVYTLLVFGLMIVMIVVACCETRKMPCGTYTSLASTLWPPDGDCGLSPK